MKLGLQTVSMPQAGLGTWAAGQANDSTEVEATIEAALEIGVRLIDTATVYQNEAAIGKALKKWIDAGKVKRQDLFIVTKLPMFALNPIAVRPMVEQSLKNLCIDYLDLYLIHSPVGIEFDFKKMALVKNDKDQVILNLENNHIGIWREMEKLVDEGKIRSIGVSNFSSPQVANIMRECRIPVAVNQVECSLYFQQKKLRDNLAKMGVKVMAYSSLGSSGRDASKLDSKSKIHNVFEDKAVGKIAKSHGKTPAQVLLRHQMQKGMIVIPKSVKKSRIEENFGVFDFSLTEEEMKELDAQDQGSAARGFSGQVTMFKYDKDFEKLKDFPFGSDSPDHY